MRILFIPNWNISYLKKDNDQIQSPDKYVEGSPYWFFKYFDKNTIVDIIDIQKNTAIYLIEKRINFYLLQPLKAFLRRRKYDVVISHGAQSGLFYSFLCRLFSFNYSKDPLHVMIDVGALNGGRINKYETPFIRFALKSNPAIIYHSSVQHELYKNHYPNILQTKFVKFGVNPNEFFPVDLPIENYILSFGYAKRDYDTLIKAWKMIKKDSCYLYIIGNPQIESSPEYNIVSLPKVQISELKKYIAKSLFVVIPLPVYNYSHGQMSFLQSMAMGKPVIVTRTPSSIDYLENGEGALFVEPYNEYELKEKIEVLLNNKDKQMPLGKRARLHIENNLTEEMMANDISNFIKKCLVS